MGYLENITFRGKVVFSVMMLVLVIIGLYVLAYKPRIARMIQTRTHPKLDNPLPIISSSAIPNTPTTTSV